MSNHKFKIGQLVESASGLSQLATQTTYEVMRLLPGDGAAVKYCVQSPSEPYQRVIEEWQVELSTSIPSPVTEKSRISLAGAKRGRLRPV